jgi:Zn-dependent protease
LKCEFCGREEPLPFVCNYCGGAFCPDHRLPEAHQCKGDLTQKRTIVAPPQTTFTWQQQPEVQPLPTSRPATAFSGIEIRDIIVAWIALGVAFGFALAGGAINLFGAGVPLVAALYLGISLVTVGPGFVLHELSHKFVARRYGFWAEFRMWPQGLVVALFLSIISPFIFAAPGATYINGTSISPSQNGKISIAGPLTNLLIALIFLPIALFGNDLISFAGLIGLEVNAFLGAFNLIPFGPLDGAKVFRWNPLVWIALLIPLAGLYVFSLRLFGMI